MYVSQKCAHYERIQKGAHEGELQRIFEYVSTAINNISTNSWSFHSHRYLIFIVQFNRMPLWVQWEKKSFKERFDVIWHAWDRQRSTLDDDLVNCLLGGDQVELKRMNWKFSSYTKIFSSRVLLSYEGKIGIIFPGLFAIFQNWCSSVVLVTLVEI